MGAREANNKPAALRVGLVAAEPHVAPLRDAIRRSDELSLAAQWISAPLRAARGVQGFDDRRVLIAQAPIDAVVLAVSPRIDAELSRAAVDRGLHCWRPAPLGRSVADAIEAAKLARGAKTACCTASRWNQAEPAIRAALAFVAQPFVYSRIRVSGKGPPLQSVWSNIVEAGGGALLAEGCAAIESLIALRGTPLSVHAAVMRCRDLASPTPRETEDLALALLRMSDGGAALLEIGWDIPPYESVAEHHAPQATLRIGAKAVEALSADGALLHRAALTDDAASLEMSRFAAAARRIPPHDSETIKRQVAVSATIEAAYLSARTTQPESPNKFFEVHGWVEASR